MTVSLEYAFLNNRYRKRLQSVLTIVFKRGKLETTKENAIQIRGEFDLYLIFNII